MRSTRDRPAKPPLSREAVVAAGLVILAAEGLGAVTMRAVAAALDTGPASLYAYVANRDELLHEMLNEVLGTVPVPVADPEHWREQLRTLLGDLVRAMEAHPGIAGIALGYIPTEPNAMRTAEAMLSLLAAGGIGPQASAWAVDLLSLYVTALAYESGEYKLPAGDGHEAMIAMISGIRQKYQQLPSTEFPLLQAMALQLTVGDGEQRFGFGFDVIVNGLLATAEPATPPDPLLMPSAAPESD
jgi:AcrR family transcriptional regulator